MARIQHRPAVKLWALHAALGSAQSLVVGQPARLPAANGGDAVERKARAFPGAEGYGAEAVGGRGGKVVFVTHLGDTGPGSLRAALMDPEPRTVVFRVSGVIELNSPLDVTSSNVTVAGETAPGGGVCLKGYGITFLDSHDIIVRHVRVRPGCDLAAPFENDGLRATGCERVIFDHCSVSWSVDQNISIRDTTDATVQWCVSSYGLAGDLGRSCNKEPRNHSVGIQVYGFELPMRASLHHNLITHCSRRTPHGSAKGTVDILMDVRNNLVFNWQTRGDWAAGSDLVTEAGGCFQVHTSTARLRANLINNCFVFGRDSGGENPDDPTVPADPAIRVEVYPAGHPDCTRMRFHEAGNRFQFGDGLFAAASGPFIYHSGCLKHEVSAPTPLGSGWDIRTEAVGDAVARIVAGAGAGGGHVYQPRDEVDVRVVWTTTLKQGQTVAHQEDMLEDRDGDGVKDWPWYSSSPRPPADGDADGIADDWEFANGLDPLDPDDHRLPSNTWPYTNLERYLHSLVISEAPPRQ